MARVKGGVHAKKHHKAVLEAAKLTLDQRVSVRIKDGCVVLEPVIKQDFDIDELLSGITPQNAHSAVDFGKPVGQEAW